MKTLSPIMIDESEDREIGIVQKLAGLDVPCRPVLVRLGQDKVSVDYMWSVTGTGSEGVLCERKTVRDLIASATDGRLERQVGVMVKFPHRFLILHVKSDRDARVSLAYSNWSWERVLGILRDVQYEGVAVEFVLGEEFANALASLYKWTGRDEHTALHRPVLPVVEGMYLDPEYRAEIAMYMCIPGIGEKAAVSLKETFGTMKGLCNAGIDAIRAVPGIGPTRASSIQSFLGTGGNGGGQSCCRGELPAVQDPVHPRRRARAAK